MTLSQASVGEGSAHAGAVSVTARFAGAVSSSLTGAADVVLSFSAGDDAEAEDFTAPGTSITLSISAAMTSSSAAALTTLLIPDDTIAEGAEEVDIGGAATGFAVTGASLIIADDDLGVTLTADTDSGMSGEQKTLEEGSTAAVRVRAAFTNVASNDLGSAFRVDVTAGGFIAGVGHGRRG